ncbi:hypothetical protein SAMN05428642_103451 [Flaviramulus basaltis]|uniref:Uncharacterized protein n=1 Tax=Flaviramulus basaltis TaxID=369401 RepID=A0A1K2INK4_9FLAO|nr:hypothetical protein [Flaviramulus basaltis]SFZ93951.1 hypothetical protein SAMN05428642_103451 [Flaviramulus basaltis]
MIKLFKNTRKKLLNEGKTSKYLKYAIGEIILVIIGILVALQVNNWNTGRIQNNDSKELSKRLLLETNQNIIILDSQIKRLNKSLNASLELLKMTGTNYKEKEIKKTDSLIYEIISTPRFELNASVLNEAITTGKVSNMKSDSLKNVIYEFPSIITTIRVNIGYIDTHDDNFLFPRIYDLISLRQVDAKFSPNKKELGESNFPITDNRILLNDIKFESIIDNKYFLTNSLLLIYHDTHKKLSILSRLLSKEIEDN